jgi:ABC-type dipeptide/oligopeptide/nickel transport system ATPase subunit
MVKIKNILLVGGTGSGKSTLANVITGTNEFKESDYSISETKKLQIGASEKFEDGEIKYQIIDTVGIGDTKSMERYLHSLAMLGDCIKDGLSQILLVTNGSLEEKTKETFDFIKEVFFDDNVIDYITIVRTNFANFGDENKIARDKERLVGKKGVFRKIVRADKVIHVNNPSIDLIINEENEESKKEMLEEQREINRIVRKESRKILLDYLEKSCKNIYKPKNLDSLNEFIETKKIEGFFQYIEDRNLTEFLENLESLREESQDSLSQISLTSKENKEEVIKQEIKKKIKQKSIIGTRILEPKLEDFFTTDLKNYLIVTSHKLYYAN